MKIDLTNFIKNGLLRDDLFIGNKIDLIKDAEDWQEQEIDTPAIYRLVKDKMTCFIECLENTIIGTSIKVNDNDDVIFYFDIEGESFVLNNNHIFSDFIDYLNRHNIKWEFDKMDTGEQSLGIIFPSGVKFMYCFHPEERGFYQFFIFDWGLYEQLAKQIQQSRKS